MRITEATLDDVEFISSYLEKHYIKLNNLVGYPKYRSEFEVMERNVRKRIKDESSLFKYFIARDEHEQSLGFVNILLDINHPELLHLEVIPNANNKEEVANLLLDTIYDKFRGIGVKNITTEVAKFNSIMLESLRGRGAVMSLISADLVIT